MLADLIKLKGGPEARSRLFDTFTGMPEADKEVDLGQMSRVMFHPGRIPETFAGIEKPGTAVAHVDLDIYQSVRTCCGFIYPWLISDYGFLSRREESG
jgi:hypothetical protein